jgi:hypothetical protein
VERRIADARIAERLIALGRDGVGGFSQVSRDDDGVVVDQRLATRTVSSLAPEERLSWREALGIVRDLARALAACERANLSPGALGPSSFAIDAPAFLPADALVAAILGEAVVQRRGSDASPKWTPPAQANGALWDAAANRYVLGLVAYRLIAGEHPFGGAGMRHAIDSRSPAPFAADVANELPPGVQSYLLGIIALDSSARPRTAREIADAFEAALRGDRIRTRSSDDGRAVPRPARNARAAPPPTPRRQRLSPRTAIPMVVGLVVAACVAVASGAKRGAPAPPHIGDARLHGTTAADCAPCHAREVAEWSRSAMAYAAKSPMFGALESAVEELVGRDARCPGGAGILRPAGADACVDERSGVVETGAGGERWCVSCHAPGDNAGTSAVPQWSASASSRAPLRDILPATSLEGISCVSCHSTVGPVESHATHRPGTYEGNATWVSTRTGALFGSRPEDREGRRGIANSGYLLDTRAFARPGGAELVHGPTADRSYLASSEFCGACHDVRLFGTDSLAAAKGEHFKRLRNAYSEWRTWADSEKGAGRAAATCVDCHMSRYPGRCVDGGSGDADCPTGSHFVSEKPGSFATGFVAPSSAAPTRLRSHAFTSVDLPLSDAFPEGYLDDTTLDEDGTPLGLRARRDTLLRHAFRFGVGAARRAGDALEVPIELENVGAGHRAPAGFSQEREVWVELSVTDARGRTVYQVGKLASDSDDLHDKTFLRVDTDDHSTDSRGRPLGVFGADVADGPDVPRWSPNPTLGGARFRGRGLVNLQNGFLRCVRCIGAIAADGSCTGGKGSRAGRFEDGGYDIDTGECRSNLDASHSFLETYFPIGGLDASRGLTKAPDAILDTRSAPPGVPLEYTYTLDARGFAPPFTVDARLRFRAFPPYLVRAFAAYEAERAREGERPSGAQVNERMLRRIDIVDLASATASIP